MSETDLLFAGTSIAGLTGILVTDWSGLFTGMFRRGEHQTVANRNGQRGNRLPFDAFNFHIGVLIEGDDEADLFANLTAAATILAGDGGLGTLERRIDNPDGSGSPYISTYAAGSFAGIDPSMINPANRLMDLTFGNLSGRWFTNSDLTVPVPI